MAFNNQQFRLLLDDSILMSPDEPFTKEICEPNDNCFFDKCLDQKLTINKSYHDEVTTQNMNNVEKNIDHGYQNQAVMMFTPDPSSPSDGISPLPSYSTNTSDDLTQSLPLQSHHDSNLIPSVYGAYVPKNQEPYSGTKYSNLIDQSSLKNYTIVRNESCTGDAYAAYIPVPLELSTTRSTKRKINTNSKSPKHRKKRATALCTKNADCSNKPRCSERNIQNISMYPLLEVYSCKDVNIMQKLPPDEILSHLDNLETKIMNTYQIPDFANYINPCKLRSNDPCLYSEYTLLVNNLQELELSFPKIVQNIRDIEGTKIMMVKNMKFNVDCVKSKSIKFDYQAQNEEIFKLILGYNMIINKEKSRFEKKLTKMKYNVEEFLKIVPMNCK